MRRFPRICPAVALSRCTFYVTLRKLLPKFAKSAANLYAACGAQLNDPQKLRFRGCTTATYTLLHNAPGVKCHSKAFLAPQPGGGVDLAALGPAFWGQNPSKRVHFGPFLTGAPKRQNPTPEIGIDFRQNGVLAEISRQKVFTGRPFFGGCDLKVG